MMTSMANNNIAEQRRPPIESQRFNQHRPLRKTLIEKPEDPERLKKLSRLKKAVSGVVMRRLMNRTDT